MGYRTKRKNNQAEKASSLVGLTPVADFSLLPILHLGTCSQAVTIATLAYESRLFILVD